MLDDRRTLAITLLRAVGEVGDWGVFPTPDAQCIGSFEAEMALIPLKDEKDAVEGFRMAHEYQTDLCATEIRTGKGDLPAAKSFLNWEGEGMVCTCFKSAADGEGWILRLFNATDAETKMSVETDYIVLRSDILERSGDPVNKDCICVGAKEIITLRIK